MSFFWERFLKLHPNKHHIHQRVDDIVPAKLLNKNSKPVVQSKTRTNGVDFVGAVIEIICIDSNGDICVQKD